MGRRAAAETELDEDDDTGEAMTTMQAPGKRHCHAPGRKHRFCSAYPVKGKDYCKKHLETCPILTGAEPAQAVVNREPAVNGEIIKATDLDDVIAQLTHDLAALTRAREILLTYADADR